MFELPPDVWSDTVHHLMTDLENLFEVLSILVDDGGTTLAVTTSLENGIEDARRRILGAAVLQGLSLESDLETPPSETEFLSSHFLDVPTHTWILVPSRPAETS
jgi:hypothetical protein